MTVWWGRSLGEGYEAMCSRQTRNYGWDITQMSDREIMLYLIIMILIFPVALIIGGAFNIIDIFIKS